MDNIDEDIQSKTEKYQECSNSLYNHTVLVIWQKKSERNYKSAKPANAGIWRNYDSDIYNVLIQKQPEILPNGTELLGHEDGALYRARTWTKDRNAQVLCEILRNFSECFFFQVILV